MSKFGSTFPSVVGAAPDNPNSDFKSPAWHEAVKREVEGRPTAILKRTPETERNEYHKRLRDAAREKGGQPLTDEEVAAIHAQVRADFS